MKLKDIMTPNVECVSPDDTLQEAARKMKALDVGPMPVCGADRIIGMLTDRDITVRATAEGCDPKTTKVREVMTEDVISCFEDQDVQEAVKTMRDKQVRRLLVLDRDKHLVGIVSLGDLVVETGDRERAGQALEGVSQPGEAGR